MRYIFLFFALIFVSCETPAPKGSASIVITDDLGRQIDFTPPAEKIICLAPSLTEMVFAAGGGDKVIAVSQADDFPSAVLNLPKFSSYPLDFEALVGHQPDLILGTSQVNSSQDADRLAELGMPTAVLSFKTIDDIPRTLKKIGEWIGTSEIATPLADSLAQIFAVLRNSDHSNGPKVLLLISDQVFYAFGGESYTQDMIHMAGGRSITANLDGASAELTEEFVLTENPDIILGTFSKPSGAEYAPADFLAKHPALASVSAVKNGHIYRIDGNLVFRPTPRLLDGIKEMHQHINKY